MVLCAAVPAPAPGALPVGLPLPSPGPAPAAPSAAGGGAQHPRPAPASAPSEPGLGLEWGGCKAEGCLIGVGRLGVSLGTGGSGDGVWVFVRAELCGGLGYVEGIGRIWVF